MNRDDTAVGVAIGVAIGWLLWRRRRRNLYYVGRGSIAGNALAPATSHGGGCCDDCSSTRAAIAAAQATAGDFSQSTGPSAQGGTVPLPPGSAVASAFEVRSSSVAIDRANAGSGKLIWPF